MSEEPLDPYSFGPEQACFGCGPHNPLGLRLRFTMEGDQVFFRYTPPIDGYEGPPGFLHGGLQATLADELAAWTIIGLKKRMGLTSSIDVRLLRPARVGVEIVGAGSIAKEVERLAIVKVKLSQEGKTTLMGRVSYQLPDAETAERILGRTMPEIWRRFCF